MADRSPTQPEIMGAINQARARRLLMDAAQAEAEAWANLWDAVMFAYFDSNDHRTSFEDKCRALEAPQNAVRDAVRTAALAESRARIEALVALWADRWTDISIHTEYASGKREAYETAWGELRAALASPASIPSGPIEGVAQGIGDGMDKITGDYVEPKKRP